MKQQGYHPIIRAMVWQQGEADARDIAGMEQSRQYSSNLKNFIEQIRKEFNSEKHVICIWNCHAHSRCSLYRT